MHPTRLILVSMLALPATPCRAQENPMVFKLGLVSTQGDARDMTQKSTGFQLEMARSFASAHPDLRFEVYGGLVKANGDRGFKPYVLVAAGNGQGTKMLGLAEYDPVKHGSILKIQRSYNFRGTYLGLDCSYQMPTRLPLRVFTGPVLTQYYIERLQPFEEPTGNTSPKVGWRLGLTYDITPSWMVSVSSTFTEFQSRNTNEKVPMDPTKPSGPMIQKHPYEPGFNPSRPWFLTFSAGYRF